jgi:hypothetical protein
LGDDRDYDGSDMIIISIAKYIFTKVWKEQWSGWRDIVL